MHKFFVSPESILNGTVLITGADARHISFSLRMRKGEEIAVSSSDGRSYRCVITGFSDGAVSAAVEEELAATAESPCRIRLFQALPKGNKLEVIIQKAVECGVSAVIPFESRFCVAKAVDAERKRERWNRVALEAAKQCGRSVVPQVCLPVSFSEAVTEAARDGTALFCYENERRKKLGAVLSRDRSDSISVIVGSEGGFAPEEVRLAEERGLTAVGLGPRILRCETASVFVLACLSLVKELWD